MFCGEKKDDAGAQGGAIGAMGAMPRIGDAPCFAAPRRHRTTLAPIFTSTGSPDDGEDDGVKLVAIRPSMPIPVAGGVAGKRALGTYAMRSFLFGGTGVFPFFSFGSESTSRARSSSDMGREGGGGGGGEEEETGAKLGQVSGAQSLLSPPTALALMLLLDTALPREYDGCTSQHVNGTIVFGALFSSAIGGSPPSFFRAFAAFPLSDRLLTRLIVFRVVDLVYLLLVSSPQCSATEPSWR